MATPTRWLSWAMGSTVLIAVLTTACVTVVKTFQVEMEVTVPCDLWPDTTAGDSFTVEVFRAATVVYDLTTAGIVCKPELEAEVSCDEPTSGLVEFGFVPEWLGIRVTHPDGRTGYAVQRVLGAGRLGLEVGPELNDWVQADYCREVSICLFGEDALQYCAGLDQPFEEVTPTPLPLSTPTPTPVP